MSRHSPRRRDNTKLSAWDEGAQRAGNEAASDEGYGDDNNARTVLEEQATPRPTRRGRQHLFAQPPLDLAAFPPPSAYSDALAQRPAFRSSNTESSVSSTRSGKSPSSKSKRAASPAKTYSHLRLLNKAVKYGIMDLDDGDLAEDIRVLVDDLQDLCENQGILPAALRDQFRGTRTRPQWFCEEARDDFKVRVEHDALCRLQAEAVSLSVTGDHESQWYCSVQWPLLQTAFRNLPAIEPKQISHALPVKECLPQTGDRYSDARLVDFAINLIPQTISDDALSEWLRRQPDSLVTVNQSIYEPLRRRPTITSIEVKVNGTEEEARVQLGIWVSAWQERARLANPDGGHRMITLPVIIVLSHRWDLYFAVDRGTYIDILQFPESIGDTLTLVKTYRILAVLRRLGQWGIDTFEPWFKSAFGIPSS